jgi:hypothetical protein
LLLAGFFQRLVEKESTSSKEFAGGQTIILAKSKSAHFARKKVCDRARSPHSVYE